MKRNQLFITLLIISNKHILSGMHKSPSAPTILNSAGTHYQQPVLKRHSSDTTLNKITTNPAMPDSDDQKTMHKASSSTSMTPAELIDLEFLPEKLCRLEKLPQESKRRTRSSLEILFEEQKPQELKAFRPTSVSRIEEENTQLHPAQKLTLQVSSQKDPCLTNVHLFCIPCQVGPHVLRILMDKTEATKIKIDALHENIEQIHRACVAVLLQEHLQQSRLARKMANKKEIASITQLSKLYSAKPFGDIFDGIDDERDNKKKYSDTERSLYKDIIFPTYAALQAANLKQ